MSHIDMYNNAISANISVNHKTSIVAENQKW